MAYIPDYNLDLQFQKRIAKLQSISMNRKELIDKTVLMFAEKGHKLPKERLKDLPLDLLRRLYAQTVAMGEVSKQLKQDSSNLNQMTPYIIMGSIALFVAVLFIIIK